MRTKAEMLEAAAEAGFMVSGHLIDDWVSKGLLDRPERPGRGRGRGRVATWNWYQLQLFLTLLHQRQKGAHIGSLANVPVWLWLLWGEPYSSVRQLRLAVQTWVATDSQVAAGNAHKAARQLVGRIAHPRATGKRELIALLEGAISSRTFNAEEITEAVRGVLDRGATGRPQGPEGAELTAERYVGSVLARLEAIEHWSKLPDEFFDRARNVYRVTRAEYQIDQPRFALDPRLGGLFEEPTAEDLVNSACLDLLSVVGLGVIGKLDRFDPWFASNRPKTNRKTSTSRKKEKPC